MDQDYVRRDEIGKLIADAVVVGVSELLASGLLVHNDKFVSAQAALHETVRQGAHGTQNDKLATGLMAVIIGLQMLFFAYLYFGR